MSYTNPRTGEKVKGLPTGYDPKGQRLTGIKVVKRGIWKKPKINLGWLRRQTIHNGSHSIGETDKKGRQGHCVMEAFAMATGQKFTDAPICVSGVITDHMQAINDSRSTDAERNKLKRVLPHIMGTAPLEVFRTKDPNTGKYHLWERKDYRDRSYIEVEDRRQKRVYDFLTRKGYIFDDPYSIVWDNVKTKDAIDAILYAAKTKRKRFTRSAKRVKV